ncbi:uncharacterized protein LOC132716584 [Ruditapes philippinarum]|uniref:uncharacterized protein LOC132716584 n=1 Tax=Ruditapes philippinarum TaxID=129788 RepID=UPI00295AD10E|nr:uncharacterized protein LOC132716584 [Ruditapes philippinarum]
MKIDSGYSDNSEDMQCPCGCKTFIKVGDNSMGHEEVWHGSVDIRVGPLAVTVTKSSIDEENSELEGKGDSAFDLEIYKLEELRHQLIPESIIFSFAMHCGLVPIVGLSKEDFKIFLYDPNEDLLYESTEFPLFVEPMPIEGRQLHISSVVAL